MNRMEKILSFFRRKKPQILTNKEKAMLLDAINVEERTVSNFPFNEFATLSDHAINEVIQKTKIHDIVMIILSMDVELRDKIYKNMSKQECIDIKNIIKRIENLKEKDIVEAQIRICSIIYYLANTGKIKIPKKFRFPDNLDQFFHVFHHPSSFNSISRYIREFEMFLNEERCELGVLETVDRERL